MERKDDEDDSSSLLPVNKMIKEMEEEINGFAHFKDSLDALMQDQKTLNRIEHFLKHELIDISIEALSMLCYLVSNDDVHQEVSFEFGEFLVEKKIVQVIAENLGRFDENLERDRFGVACSLDILESLLESASGKSELKTEVFLPFKEWILVRIQMNSLSSSLAEENTITACEILALVLQDSACTLSNEEFELLFRRQMHSSNEALTEAICACLLYSEGNLRCFVEDIEYLKHLIGEIRNGKKSNKENALTILDFALSDKNSPLEKSISTRLAKNFVQESGIKCLFSLLMKSKCCSEMENLCFSIAYSLICRLLLEDSPERQRVIEKFKENDREKYQRLLFSIQSDSKENDSFITKQCLLEILDKNQ